MDAAAALFGGRLPLAQTYARLLSTSGVERGLIGPREVPRLWDRHLLNCAAVHEIIPPGASVADVGSGAGLPGIVLAIARPDLRITLIEPLLRRTTWLTEALIELGLDHVSVTRDRADAVAATARRFDIVTARAVAPLPKLVGWCLPLLSPGGELLALKGSSAADELIEAEPLLRRLGASAWSVETCGSNLLVTPTTVLRISVSESGSPDR